MTKTIEDPTCDELEAELGRIPGEIAAAANAADGAALIRLQRRRDELPSLVFAARVTELRALVDAYETDRVEADDKLGPAGERLLAAQQALQEAQAAVAAARTEFDVVKARRYDAQQDGAAVRRELEQLLGEHGRDRGPIVRSRIHASG